MNILVIGGSRFVGPYVISALAKDKHKVTVFNRGAINITYPQGIKLVIGDRNKGFGLNEKFDAVIDMCSYTGEQTKSALNQLKFDYYLHFGTVAAYKKTEIFPLTEESEIGRWPAFGDYNKGKVECEKVFKRSGIKYAIIRPVYILGPKNYCDRENFIYSRIKNNEPLILPGNGMGIAQFVFADEVAKIITKLAEEKITGTYNVTGDQMITIHGLVQEMADIIGKNPIIIYNPLAVGENYNEEEFPFDNENMIVANEKIKKLGFRFISLSDGLRRDYKSFYKDHLE